MVDDVATLYCLREGSVFQKVGLEQLELSGMFRLQVREWIVLLAVFEIADCRMHAMAAFKKKLDDIQADEACTARDKCC